MEVDIQDLPTPWKDDHVVKQKQQEHLQAGGARRQGDKRQKETSSSVFIGGLDKKWE